MQPEQRQMNNRTFRECIIVRNEVEQARMGKELRLRDYPAAIVSCADSWNNVDNASIGRSGKVTKLSYQYTPALETALSNLGAIGGKRDECCNYIGACAEPHAAKRVMESNPGASVNGLVFSYAYRPRTKTVLRYCRNCTDVFNVQNP